MSETSISLPPVVDAAPVQPDEALGDSGKRALDAERLARKAAEAESKAAKEQLDAIKKSQMSDLEKATTEAREAREAAAKATADADRWRIAAKYRISDEDAETFLTGGTVESLTRQAERLSTLAGAKSDTPKPDLTQGSRGSTQHLSTGEQFAAFFNDNLI